MGKHYSCQLSDFGVEQHVACIGQAVCQLEGFCGGNLSYDLTRLACDHLDDDLPGVFIDRELQIALDRLNKLFDLLHRQFQLGTVRVLTLGRDRLGEKPLYYGWQDRSFLFGSELKALLAHPSLRREIDPLAIEDYLAWGYVPDHRSILKGVEKLPAGHYRLVRHDQPASAPVRWWDVSFTERRRESAADLEAELLFHLREAVTSRMVADVPLGAFLSGGVDSSSVVALMAESSRERVRTCSIGFDDDALDEAIDRVIAGPQKRTRVMDDQEKMITAYHEGGHALVAAALVALTPAVAAAAFLASRALMLSTSARGVAANSVFV